MAGVTGGNPVVFRDVDGSRIIPDAADDSPGNSLTRYTHIPTQHLSHAGTQQRRGPAAHPARLINGLDTFKQL